MIVDTTNGNVTQEIMCNDVQSVEWSPLGGYLVTWSRISKSASDGATEGNLKVWSAQRGEVVSSFNQRQMRKGSIQWSSDESYCLRCVTNEIHVLNSSSPTSIMTKVIHKGVMSYQVSPVPPLTVAVFNPQSGGNPGRAAIYRCSFDRSTDNAVCSRTVMSATEANILWNKIGTAVLIHTQCDVDTSNSSYYGTTGNIIYGFQGANELTDLFLLASRSVLAFCGRAIIRHRSSEQRWTHPRRCLVSSGLSVRCVCRGYAMPLHAL